MGNAQRPLPRLLGVLLAALCLCAAGCRGEAASTGGEEGVAADSAAVLARPSANLEIAGERIYWGHNEELWAADLASDGSLEDFELLGSFDDTVRAVALFEDSLYALTVEGVYRLDAGGGPSDAEHLVEDGARDDFWVTSEGLLYREDETLSRSTLAGEDAIELRGDVKDFCVASGSLYVLTGDGALVRCSLDGSGEVEIDGPRDRDDEAVLLVDDEDVYLVSDDLLVCAEGSDALEDVGLEHEIDDPGRVVVSSGEVIYKAANGEAFRHVGDGGEDRELDHALFWGKPCARLHNGFVYYTISGSGVDVVDWNTLDYETFEPEGDDDETGPSEADEGVGTRGGASDERAARGTDYDIAEGMEMRLAAESAVLTTAHFSLALDRSEVEAGLWDIEATGPNAIAFCYAPASEAGLGGRVFTLVAYDWGDNSYAEAPATQLAGTSADKKYVVILPTDLQYDSSDPTQRDQYARMRAFAQRMDANANPADNPLTILDS